MTWITGCLIALGERGILSGDTATISPPTTISPNVLKVKQKLRRERGHIINHHTPYTTSNPICEAYTNTKSDLKSTFLEDSTRNCVWICGRLLLYYDTYATVGCWVLFQGILVMKMTRTQHADKPPQAHDGTFLESCNKRTWLNMRWIYFLLCWLSSDWRFNRFRGFHCDWNRPITTLEQKVSQPQNQRPCKIHQDRKFAVGIPCCLSM